MSWYLRSTSDRDTHCGELQPDGTVAAVCGAVFRPVCYLHGNDPALPDRPPDPDQVCPHCYRGRRATL